MIFSTVIAAAFAAATPASAVSNIQPRIQVAGLFGKRRWVELPQQVQTEYEYAPPAGRQPEPAPEPLVPTRFLTPQQRALPVIVEPAPIYVTRPDPAAAAPAPAASEAQSDGETGGQEYRTPTPSYITSAPPTAEREQERAPASTPAPPAAPAGSATGSNATVTYGQPPR